MSKQRRDLRLTEADYGRLADLLEMRGPQAMNIEKLDGFLACLVCCARRLKPDEYLPLALGFSHRDDRPIAAELRELIARLWNTIESALIRAQTDLNEVYLPPLLAGADGVARGNDWAMGFLQGAAL